MFVCESEMGVDIFRIIFFLLLFVLSLSGVLFNILFWLLLLFVAYIFTTDSIRSWIQMCFTVPFLHTYTLSMWTHSFVCRIHFSFFRSPARKERIFFIWFFFGWYCCCCNSAFYCMLTFDLKRGKPEVATGDEFDSKNDNWKKKSRKLIEAILLQQYQHWTSKKTQIFFFFDKKEAL